ncbi:MAG: ribonuclease P protein component [Candidatus Caldatribacterium sp.]|nr:ribonuclease P protein component [Candidatus Caldatribacterium sp.]
MMETLTRQRDFARLFEEGQRASCGPVRLFFYRRETGPVRVCFAGRSKKAVCRNRIRRRLREAFRVHYYPTWKDKPFDLFFIGDESVASVDFASLVLWMGDLLERVEKLGEDRRNPGTGS